MIYNILPIVRSRVLNSSPQIPSIIRLSTSQEWLCPRFKMLLVSTLFSPFLNFSIFSSFLLRLKLLFTNALLGKLWVLLHTIGYIVLIHQFTHRIQTNLPSINTMDDVAESMLVFSTLLLLLLLLFLLKVALCLFFSLSFSLAISF